METTQRELLISRICSGVFITTIGGTRYIVKSPTRLQRYLAQLEYEEALKELEFENLLRRPDTLNVLIANRLVEPNIDETLKKLENDVERIKHQLFLHHLDSSARTLRHTLKATKNAHSKLLQIRHSLDHLTQEGYADAAKTFALFSFCLYDENDNHIDDHTLVEKVVIRLNENRITAEQFRELARTEPWRSYWTANSDYVYGTPVVDWTEDQRSLVIYSKMYDSAYKHTDPPSDYIIHDDDLFDGWMIHQRKEVEKSRKDQNDKSLQGKAQNAHEVYKFPTKEDLKYKTKEEFVADVNNKNSIEAKIKKQQREAALAKGKVLKEVELPDVKRELQMQAQQQFAEKFKNKGR